MLFDGWTENLPLMKLCVKLFVSYAKQFLFVELFRPHQIAGDQFQS